jgi:hypothetical protein
MTQRARSIRTLPLVALAGAALLLAACDETAVMRLTGGDPRYDGQWSGRITFSIGTAACPRRGAIAFEARGGVISGSVRFPELEARRVLGKILEGGVVEGGEIKRGSIPWADLTGTFQAADASGRWKSRECEGSWEARKLSG